MTHKPPHQHLWGMMFLLVLLVCSCIELTGQRVTLHHDPVGDRLLVLLHYDGISNSEPDKQEKAEEDLRNFVQGGDVMLFDWFLHFPRHDFERRAGDTDAAPAERALATRLLESVEVTSLGHYRDPNGRLGAAQLVVIHEASAMLAAANAAISEALLGLPAQTKEGHWDRTVRLWHDLAERGHAWLSIEGHSLVCRLRVDEGEWTSGKYRFLVDLEEMADDDDAGLSFLRRFFSAALLSLVQERGEVTVRLGMIDEPHTLRCELRTTYEPNVAVLVKELVPSDLDRELARSLLGEAPASVPVSHVIAWGPAEERVRAVLGAAASIDEDRAARCRRWLEAFAHEWNAARRFPEAPVLHENEAAYLELWRAWYRTLVGQPRL